MKDKERKRLKKIVETKLDSTVVGFVSDYLDYSLLPTRKILVKGKLVEEEYTDCNDGSKLHKREREAW